MSTLRKFFLQDVPRLGNQYLEDTALRNALKRIVPNEVLSKIEPDLIRFGSRVVKDVWDYGREAERNPPKFTPTGPWGQRKDDIYVSGGWKQLGKIAAEEGLISIGYERQFGEYSRLYQLTKMFLFAPSSAVYQCPLSMADGGARLLELHCDKSELGAGSPYSHLISRDPNQVWTSGQWMTERTGGSDVGRSETIAKLGKDGKYRLYGYKFFTSAITSEMALLLARIEGENGEKTEGSRGLSTFLIYTRKPDGSLNDLIVHKLKDKMGTKAVPTAEIELNGSIASLIGLPNQGVKTIATILNITRIHNATAAVSGMRRNMAIARDYAFRRQAFGSDLSNNLLHLQTLADMEIEYRGALQFLLHVIHLFGASETKKSSPEDTVLLRLLTPLLKLYTGKQAIAVASEGIESLGGTGYMEDSGVPAILRDAQVTSIWEGTTNVLASDIWRPISQENAFSIFAERVSKRLQQARSSRVNESAQPAILAIEKGLNEANQFLLKYIGSTDKQMQQTLSRYFAFGLSRIYMGSLLLDQAIWSSDPIDVEVANRWATEKPIISLPSGNNTYRTISAVLALDIDPSTKKPRNVGDVDVTGAPRSML